MESAPISYELPAAQFDNVEKPPKLPAAGEGIGRPNTPAVSDFPQFLEPASRGLPRLQAHFWADRGLRHAHPRHLRANERGFDLQLGRSVAGKMLLLLGTFTSSSPAPHLFETAPHEKWSRARTPEYGLDAEE